MRIIKVANEYEMEDKIEYYIRNGYSVKTQTEKSIVMSKKRYGSFWLHLLFLLISAGILNIFYLIYALSKTSNDVMIQIARSGPSAASNHAGEMRNENMQTENIQIEIDE